MRQSQAHLPFIKETPADAEAVSHKLMLRAGLIRPVAAGIQAWLPMGLRVLRKVEHIIRTQQERFGAEELLMPILQPEELWQESGRAEAYGPEMVRLQDRKSRPLLLGPTHEELVTDLFRRDCKSWRDVPRILYQISWKFRDERRPRFGVMRGREFLMKDAYSFDLDEAGAMASYHRMFASYMATFAAMGLTAVPVRAATGPIGGAMSHEFHVLADTGESEVFADRALLSAASDGDLPAPGDDLAGYFDRITAQYSAADEMHDAQTCPVAPDDLVTRRGIEIGHIFQFGTKYSDAMGATVSLPDGSQSPVHMGSYGIGVSRLVAAIIEASHDDRGIIWPASVAPFDVHLVNLKQGDRTCDALADRAEHMLRDKGMTVLHDDRQDSPGAKLAGADLLGLPRQIIIGPRHAADGHVEVKDRRSGACQIVSLDTL
ncbi:MAG: proline--tRNA ligase [Alphaproteobacteria bacterium]